ncbi:uncharacterized protein M421DRAFT_300177 [Didymella exigua CBS 183.55]|uniref:Uncharacterized protein n=1 Tax=Didymella exigua CBS 183.55 TaxID=1150837 RepID=A0A6A5R9N1_9PLEO|nr:uncharacterized protein M421DRAFT_300177 [Didymella exigua CBS 183.55]KAF1924039.1 hypothetical protein M421DRAFT_300177 [Didymella exigua CBS 183.55]
MEEFQQAVGADVKTILFRTACHSGGWVVRQNLNRTVLAVAGPQRLSPSWNASESITRRCGSMCASAFSRAREVEVGASAPSPWTGPTCLKLAKDVYEALLTTDRMAKKHDMRLAAQGDNWVAAWPAVSAFSTVDFQARYHKLDVYASTALAPWTATLSVPTAQTRTIRTSVRHACSSSLV